MSLPNIQLSEKAQSILKGIIELNRNFGAGITGLAVRWFIKDRGLTPDEIDFIVETINVCGDRLSDEAFRDKHGIDKPWGAKDAGMVVASNLSDIQHLIGIGRAQEASERCNAIKSYIFDTKDGWNYKHMGLGLDAEADKAAGY